MRALQLNRKSLYWDLFDQRIKETVAALKDGRQPPVRRVAVFITNRCNFHCSYCRHPISSETMSESVFRGILDKYGDTAIIHITGGEPSLVPWLYPLIEATGHQYRYHVNTNAYIKPPAQFVQRLKTSLDTHKRDYFDTLTDKQGSFDKVIENIEWASKLTTTSITCTLTKDNFRDSVDFADFVNSKFPSLYALFFSVYKGNNPRFVFDANSADIFAKDILPKLPMSLNPESQWLLQETIDEKKRLIQGVRFPENEFLGKRCYLSLSERVIAPNGQESYCSHLYRDGVKNYIGNKHPQCSYGCNRKLIKFNEEVSNLL